MKLELLSMAFLFFGCSSAKLPEQKPVDHIDIDKFMGPWYVIANIPTFPEKGAVNAVESYTWNEKKQEIAIDFHFNQDKADGPLVSYPQKAWIHNKETNSEWRVQPFWPLAFSYLIVDVAPDYSDTIIGRPGRENVWVMARTKTMKPERFDELALKIKNLGYDMSKFEKVPQY